MFPLVVSDSGHRNFRIKLTKAPGAIRGRNVWFFTCSCASLIQLTRCQTVKIHIFYLFLFAFQNVGTYENSCSFELDRRQCTAKRFIRRFGVGIVWARHRLDATGQITNASKRFDVPERLRSRADQSESGQQRHTQWQWTRTSGKFLQRSWHRGKCSSDSARP